MLKQLLSKEIGENKKKMENKKDFTKTNLERIDPFKMIIKYTMQI
jgi:hypothetical protein